MVYTGAVEILLESDAHIMYRLSSKYGFPYDMQKRTELNKRYIEWCFNHRSSDDISDAELDSLKKIDDYVELMFGEKFIPV